MASNVDDLGVLVKSGDLGGFEGPFPIFMTLKLFFVDFE